MIWICYTTSWSMLFVNVVNRKCCTWAAFIAAVLHQLEVLPFSQPLFQAPVVVAATTAGCRFRWNYSNYRVWTCCPSRFRLHFLIPDWLAYVWRRILLDRQKNTKHFFAAWAGGVSPATPEISVARHRHKLSTALLFRQGAQMIIWYGSGHWVPQ